MSCCQIYFHKTQIDEAFFHFILVYFNSCKFFLWKTEERTERMSNFLRGCRVEGMWCESYDDNFIIFYGFLVWKNVFGLKNRRRSFLSFVKFGVSSYIKMNLLVRKYDLCGREVKQETRTLQKYFLFKSPSGFFDVLSLQRRLSGTLIQCCPTCVTRPTGVP